MTTDMQGFNSPPLNNPFNLEDTDSDIRLLASYGYDYIADIGEGAYSNVKLFYSRPFGHHVAIKIIDKKLAKGDFVSKFLPREIKTLHRVKHPNIVDCHEILTSSDGKIFIVLEYTRHNDVLKQIQENGAFEEKRAQHLFGQLVEAVGYMHGLGLVHRDLKCENLLLTNSSLLKCRKNLDNLIFDSDLSVKRTITAWPLKRFFDPKTIKLLLTDFGFAREFKPEELSRTFCGSSAYAAPEITQGISYMLPGHDMWALGIILYIMLEGSMPYDDSNPYNMIREQLAHKIKYRRNSCVTPQCRVLIGKLIEPDTGKRMTISQLKEDPWIIKSAIYSKHTDTEPLSSIIQKQMDRLTMTEKKELSSDDTIDELIKAIIPFDDHSFGSRKEQGPSDSGTHYKKRENLTKLR